MGEKKVIKKTLKALMQEAQDRFPMMNYGGCGVFAGEVCEALVKAGIDAEVVTRGEPPKSIRQRLKKKPTKATCLEWDTAGLDRGHLAVRMKIGKKFYTYDSETFLKSGFEFGGHGWECSYPFGDGMTYKEAKAISADNSNGDWNDTFDRAQIPSVKKTVRKHLRPLKELLK